MKITDTIRYAGVNDHQIDLFEGQYKVPNGMAYNSYVILDEKIAVMDTVDANFTHEWLDNLDRILEGQAVLYCIDEDGNQYMIDNLKKDSVFGEPFLLPEESQHYYVCAKSETRVLFIAYEHVIKRCENACKFHSQLVSNLLQMIALRASQQASRIYVLSRNSTRKKIMAYLNSIAAEKQTKTVTLPMSYTTLAEYLSVDRSAMMRELKNLTDEGVIERDGKKLRILDGE